MCSAAGFTLIGPVVIPAVYGATNAPHLLSSPPYGA